MSASADTFTPAPGSLLVDPVLSVVVLVEEGREDGLPRTLRSISAVRADLGTLSCKVVVLEGVRGAARSVGELLPPEIHTVVLDTVGLSRWSAIARGNGVASTSSPLTLFSGEELAASAVCQQLGLPRPDPVATATLALERMNLAVIFGSAIHPLTVFEGVADFRHPFENGRPARFGAFTYSNSPITLGVRSIGRYCSIGADVTFAASEHPTSGLTTSPFVYAPDHPPFGEHALRSGGLTPELVKFDNTDAHRDIVIENDVWIGNRVSIKGGVTLGTGCIIGTGAVVTKDVPPYAVVGGVPARVRRMRFTDDLVVRLLASEWWRYDPVALARLDLGHPEIALEQLDELVAAGDISPWAGEDRPLLEVAPGLPVA